MGKLVDDILFDTAQSFYDLKVKVRGVNQSGKLPEDWPGGRGKRSKVAREIRREERVLENFWYCNSFHRVNGQHSLD